MMKKEKILLIGLAILLISIASIQFTIAIPIWSDDTGTNFFTGGNAICSTTSTSSSWNINGIPSDAMNDCYNENGVDSNGNEKTSCCSSGQTCNTATDRCEAGIIPPQPTATRCSDYIQAYCGRYLPTEEIKNLIEEQAGVEDDDGNLVRFCHNNDGKYINEDSCIYAECGGCIWSNSQDKCVESYLLGNICTDSDPTLPGARVRCETTTNQLDDQCNEPGGSIILSWTGRLIYLNADGTSGGAVPSTLQSTTYMVQAQHCTPNSKEFPCPIKSTLPFFTGFSFIISLLAIAMIYYLIHKKKIKLIEEEF